MRIGQLFDDVFKPLAPTRVHFVRADLLECSGAIWLALRIADDLEAAPEERVVLEPRGPDGSDELGPYFIVAPLVFVFGARLDVECEADPFHSFSPFEG